ncbi:MAG: hypothetical protein LBU76_07850 [Azoarcus sp.]|nr:hypothetical protein [Azoarcus sp.]
MPAFIMFVPQINQSTEGADYPRIACHALISIRPACGKFHYTSPHD